MRPAITHPAAPRPLVALLLLLLVAGPWRIIQATNHYDDMSALPAFEKYTAPHNARMAELRAADAAFEATLVGLPSNERYARIAARHKARLPARAGSYSLSH